MKIFITQDVIYENEYIDNINTLIEESRKFDSTVIPHTKEELLYRYDKSLIYIDNEKIIGHLSIYSTIVNELIDLNIWEIWSVIVDPIYRWKWLWYNLLKKWIENFWNQYDWIIWATINQTMVHLLKEIW